MSRAYCLTCNEHVHETPSGTCPLGHPVATNGFGPEPWVGFAGDTAADAAEVPMQHLDTSGQPREHAGVGQSRNGTSHANGTVNGSANGSSNGHVASLASSSVAFPSVEGSDQPTPDELASDDLTSLLAEALRQNSPEEPATTPTDEPAPSVDEEWSPRPTAEPAASDDGAEWSELASLAAELHLDETVASDDGPGAPVAPVAEPTPHGPTDLAPEGDLSASSIDDLLAELTGGTADPAPPVADMAAEPPPIAEPAASEPSAPEPAAFEPSAPEPAVADTPPAPTDDITAWDTPPPPPRHPDDATAWDTPSPVPSTEDPASWDAAPLPDDVGSAPEASPDDPWAEPDTAPVEEPTPAPTVDLYNFTARGKRVGDAGSALPAKKKKRGRKR